MSAFTSLCVSRADALAILTRYVQAHRAYAQAQGWCCPCCGHLMTDTMPDDAVEDALDKILRSWDQCYNVVIVNEAFANYDDRLTLSSALR